MSFLENKTFILLIITYDFLGPSMGSSLSNCGWRVEEVAKLTGDTIAVIQEHYSTPSDMEMQEAVVMKAIIWMYYNGGF